MANTKFFLRIRILLRHILERKQIGTHETFGNSHDALSDTHETPSTSSLLLKLPNEMILNIAVFLDQESRVLLSLSCKLLRNILNSHLDLSLSDLGVRTKFLQILERELPDYLTCRACGWMFLWRKRSRYFGCSCPRARDHRNQHWWAGAYVPVCPLHTMLVTPEMVDLVLRAYHRGPQHGLPFSFMDSNHKGSLDKTLQTKARIVGGDLMLLSQRTLDVKIDEEKIDSQLYLESAICLHRWPMTVSGLWRRVVLTARSTDCTNGFIIYKCPECTTDCEIHLQKLRGGHFKITLSVWKSFGDGRSNPLGVQPMFKTRPTCQLDPRALSERSLRAKFSSQGIDTSFPVACQHTSNGEPKSIHGEGVSQLNRDQVLVSNGRVCY